MPRFYGRLDRRDCDHGQKEAWGLVSDEIGKQDRRRENQVPLATDLGERTRVQQQANRRSQPRCRAVHERREQQDERKKQERENKTSRTRQDTGVTGRTV